MSGIAVLLDLLRKNPNFSSTKTLHSFHSFSASAAVSGVAASVLAAYPFGYRAFLGRWFLYPFHGFCCLTYKLILLIIWGFVDCSLISFVMLFSSFNSCFSVMYSIWEVYFLLVVVIRGVFLLVPCLWQSRLESV